MNDRFKFRVPVFYDGKFKAFKKYSLCNGVVIWKEPETIGELWIEDELKRNNPHLSLGHDEQCTGLNDKTGKLIYEGDIIRIPDKWDDYGLMAGEQREVYFFAGGFRLKPKYKYSKNNRGYWLEDTDDFEIIGNIHENPELLKSEEQ